MNASGFAWHVWAVISSGPAGRAGAREGTGVGSVQSQGLRPALRRPATVTLTYKRAPVLSGPPPRLPRQNQWH